MVNETVKSICTMVRTLGSSSPSVVGGGRMFRLVLQVEDIFVGKNTDEYEGVISKFLDLVYDKNIGFEKEKSTIANGISNHFCLTNYDKGERIGKYKIPSERPLPDEYSTLAIIIPTAKWDDIMGYRSCGVIEGRLNQKINPYPKTIVISLWDTDSDSVFED